MEAKVLRFSILVMFMFALLGIIFGLLLQSEVIIFDGLFSLFSILLSYFTLLGSRFIHKKDHFNFPFGKEIIEPIIVLVQYTIVLLVLIYTFQSAVYTIIAGGNELQLGWVIMYVAISTLLVYLVVLKIRKFYNKDEYSTLVDAEIKSWEVTLTQSLGVLIGYILAQIAVWLSFTNITPYIDPVILLIVVVVASKTPIIEIKNAMKEMIGMKSISDEFQKSIQVKLDDIVTMYGISKSYLRVQKRGSLLFIEIDFLVEKDFKYSKIADQDMIREKVEDSLQSVPYDLWLTIAFTSHRKWAE